MAVSCYQFASCWTHMWFNILTISSPGDLPGWQDGDIICPDTWISTIILGTTRFAGRVTQGQNVKRLRSVSSCVWQVSYAANFKQMIWIGFCFFVFFSEKAFVTVLSILLLELTICCHRHICWHAGIIIDNQNYFTNVPMFLMYPLSTFCQLSLSQK